MRATELERRLDRKLCAATAFVTAAVAILAISSAADAKKAVCDDGKCEVPNISSEENRVLTKEKEALWKAINWQENASAASAVAREQNKPLLVVLSVGQRGKADAPDT